MKHCLAVVAALAATSTLCAAPINIAGNGSLGDFTGTFDYVAGSPTSGTVTVTLTNAATTLPGGKITGFVFNIPSGATVTAVSYNAAGPNGTAMTLVGNPAFNNGAPGNPFGDFDLGAALGGNFMGGGSPNPGLAIGQTGTYTFALTGTGLDTLTPASFFGPGSQSSSPGGPGARNFLVRFRGFDNGGSEKVSGVVGDPRVDPDGNVESEVVPEPATLVTVAVLGGMGLIGYRLRRTKA